MPSVIWMRPVRGRRGPEPSRDRDAIARAAIAVADREGLAAVSMRRIAAEIGTSASSLYRYVARKDDLLNLMVDAALGAGELQPSGDWRMDLQQIGHAMRAVFKAHPWLTTALAGRPTLGPNRLRALEAMLTLLAPSGLPLAEQLALIDVLTSYVRGFVASELASDAAIRQSGLSAAQWHADQAAYTAAIRASGVYPLTSALFDELQRTGAADQDAGFAAGLDIVLEGIAARWAVVRHGKPT
ncbi:MAG: hypothetical protein BGO82_01280 [Devosia sp. 67-54]|mgnify:FL=1|uniref:TetR/AcrR family transcriptional regulator n=1 Tax=unclassified Devosia TaxID=196773 RepID=UPI000969C62F|nr:MULTISPECIES: TetR/AcrR family transcriptional regulator [unclassified Devosia]MBN9305902.1 TetR/AcrR family transcriptional regulator C-terminal domain-containing protein [Devosia sp.]OJX16404.1 MAG: hypothetical protein BGO82_01280 [Devosia sp. 67-54]